MASFHSSIFKSAATMRHSNTKKLPHLTVTFPTITGCWHLEIINSHLCHCQCVIENTTNYITTGFDRSRNNVHPWQGVVPDARGRNWVQGEGVQGWLEGLQEECWGLSRKDNKPLNRLCKDCVTRKEHSWNVRLCENGIRFPHRDFVTRGKKASWNPFMIKTWESHISRVKWLVTDRKVGKVVFFSWFKEINKSGSTRRNQKQCGLLVEKG